MQTILGANGVIATELSKQLPAYNQKIRQVSRNPKKVNESDELLVADLLDREQTERAVAGSEVVYLLAGLKYDIKTWREQWPKLMRNVIDACKKYEAKLVFFDNVYCYGLVKGPMTEETPYNPTSKKGEVRANVATMLVDDVRRGNIRGMIVRAADFYGPGALLSMTHSTVTERLKAHKGAQWLGNTKATHSFTYTPDAGKTVARLGNTASAYNQTWHALTSKEPMSGEQYVRIASKIMGAPYKLQALPKFGVSIVGMFNPTLHEIVEMMYQFEHDYIFDSSKFENAFNEKATSYEEGIAATLR